MGFFRNVITVCCYVCYIVMSCYEQPRACLSFGIVRTWMVRLSLVFELPQLTCLHESALVAAIYICHSMQRFKHLTISVSSNVNKHLYNLKHIMLLQITSYLFLLCISLRLYINF